MTHSVIYGWILIFLWKSLPSERSVWRTQKYLKLYHYRPIENEKGRQKQMTADEWFKIRMNEFNGSWIDNNADLSKFI